ncbi:RNA-splicing ligase RtcB [uncultured Pleomorphomonas sp.]|uniref:3'-phosphate/5'-hydroxy nucleic acid ligase n=1 Tax=uncultured Pleomorphomonas sp. TaxID=442121 RepID=A0A212L206_9HYPH|nr:RtcB family protein [uncultured Pleomorphomonas sp.]SCM71585.1 RNA-splicing ligase RtcB [uncultured Pleomorphomonas sp.]
MPPIIYGNHDERTLAQLDRCLAAGSAAAGVLCADGHLGYAHPIGGVVGYTNHISISGVGFDIACGNMAVRLDARAEDLKPQLGTILSDIASCISFGIGRSNGEKVDHALFDSDLWKAADVEDLKPMARDQLGTVGSGNHYVDILEDEDGFAWIGVHFGSRGLGHKITTKYLKAVGAKDGMEVDPALIEADSDLGRGYLAGVELGGLYAYAGRAWVVERVRRLIGASANFTVHNHHNFVWQETHGGVGMWVVRKGATPAFPGQYGFVGGSMGDNAVILRGVESEKSAASLYSTVHGAGRIMSRTEARGRFVKDERGKKIRQPGRVRHDDWQTWLRDFGVMVIGGDVDEAPQAYRRLDEVLAEHAGTVEVVHTLKPIGVLMAGNDAFDPYKD